MSRTLNFVDHLLDMGRKLEVHGQTRAAARLLNRVSSFNELPRNSVLEAHLRLAQMHLQSGRHKRARRHLAALLTMQPDHAEAHYMMACAIADDDTGKAVRALAHYRRCTKLDADNPRYWCELGVFALSLAEKEEGLNALRRAEKLAPDSPSILADVVQGLREEGETAEATRTLRTALFRNPRNQAIRDLWTRHQFQLLHSEQQQAKQQSEPAHARCRILPFARPVAEEATVSTKRIRRDAPSGLPGPKMPRRGQAARKSIR